MPPASLPYLKEVPETPRLPMIYILGNSHSGSTLLGFLLTSNPRIVNLGEIKSRTWLKDRFCSCGHPVAACPFYAGYFEKFNTLKQSAFTNLRKVSPLRLLRGDKINLAQPALSNLSQLYASISEQVLGMYPDAQYWIDTSKSTWTLNAWLQVVPQEDIRIIWIKRQLKANVSSFVKRGSSFTGSLIRININNFVIGRFLRKNKLSWLEINYDQFYEGYAGEAKKISAFIGAPIPATYIPNQNHHAISGNKMTRESFTAQFTGLRKDDEWQHILTGLQQKILTWIS